MAVALTTNDEETQCVCDMIIVAYFFLLRPGEYIGAKSDSTPFRMCDIKFSCGRAVFDHKSEKQDLRSATMVMLLFTTEKNGVKGEVVGQGPSRDPLLCPRDTLARRIIHLRKHNADKTRTIASFMTPNGSWKHVTPTMITKVLKCAVSLSGDNLEFILKDVSARSLWAADAMALLCSAIDTDIIRLIGRWRSDEMLRYLHLQAEPLMQGFSKRMVTHGNYSILPGQRVLDVPCY